ncbi:RNA ligase (ATP) [Ferruginibacter sp. SUN106]|uniref:RNA ligase (ATP) n=1 Tax=Ferruginibacter sp. SUN106 TaxID=2978348 RepID=UPI003D35E13E
MRQLASIQKIKRIESIPGADAIVKATVLGWQLVVKKGEFNEGDFCVYVEIDALLPDKTEFEFMKPRGMRVRTVRLRGQVSQGICFPLSILPQNFSIEEGLDVTEVLAIEKYEPPIPANLSGIMKADFPSFIPKTDETRVQVLQELLDKFKDEPCYITEKLDGTSVTYFIKDGVFGVCSRNLELVETADNTLWKLAREMQVEEKLRAVKANYALQGEVIGEGIQGNKYKLKGQQIFFFSVFNIDAYEFLDHNDFVLLIEELGFNTVPVLETNYSLSVSIEALVNKAIGKSVLYNVDREGIVIRPLVEKTDTIGRVSFKAINPEFLLKYE